MDKDKLLVGSVVKAFRILDCFDDKNRILTLADITRKTGYPKTTVYGLLSTLENEHIIAKDNTVQGYRLGVQLFKHAYIAKISMPIIQIVSPIMKQLSVETGENVYLTTHSKGRVLFLEGIHYDHTYINYSETGKTLPMHCSASGKAMLANMTEDEVDAIFKRYPLEKKTINTMTDPVQIKKELAVIARQGYALDMEEESIGVRCVSVAILNNDNRPVGAISISGSVPHMTDENARQYYQLLMRQMRIIRMNADLFPCQY